MPPSIDSLGIIAGSHTLPILFAQQARRMGIKRLVAVAFVRETNPKLGDLVDEIIWIRVGQLSKLISAFTGHGIVRCVMLGQIAPQNLFEVRPDRRALSLLLKLKEKNAHSLFGAIAEEMKRDGVELIEATPWLQPMMPASTFHLGPALSIQQQADVAFGLHIAKAISRLDIGQTAVVKNGTVLAVEGFEGTDRCLTRGGALAGTRGGAVALKVAKKNHDFRFDIPCVGAQTVETCLAAKISVLALEANKTLLLEQELIETLMKGHKFSLTTVE